MQEILQKQGMIGGKQMRFRCRKTPINLLSIQVFGAGGSPQLQSKSITPSTSTQHVYPSSRYDGLSQVTVNGDSNLVSNNIKKGASIFGITGNYPSSTDVNPKSYSLSPTTTSNSCYFKIPSSINPLSILRLQLGRLNISSPNYQLHIEKDFSNWMRQRILTAFLGLNAQSEDNRFLFQLDGYFTDRSNTNTKYLFASVERFWGTSTHYGVTNIITFNKDSDGGINVNIPNWIPKAKVFNSDGSENYQYSSITYPYWSQIVIYYYEID